MNQANCMVIFHVWLHAHARMNHSIEQAAHADEIVAEDGRATSKEHKTISPPNTIVAS